MDDVDGVDDVDDVGGHVYDVKAAYLPALFNIAAYISGFTGEDCWSYDNSARVGYPDRRCSNALALEELALRTNLVLDDGIRSSKDALEILDYFVVAVGLVCGSDDMFEELYDPDPDNDFLVSLQLNYRLILDDLREKYGV